MKMSVLLIALILLLPLASVAPTGTAYQQPQVERQAGLTDAEAAEAQSIFERLVADYRHDPMAISGEFGLRVADRWWTVSVQRKETPVTRGRLTDHAFGPHEVTLRAGQPETPTYVFAVASMPVLRLIAEGEVNAGTAAMQTFGADQVGLETKAMPGFEMDAGDVASRYHHLAHFFTTGIPEITRFGPEYSLETHGAQMTALHFSKQFRIGYFTMQPQQTANAAPELQRGQVPNLFIVTKGRGIGYLGDRQIELKPGMSVFVAPYVRHEFTAVGDEPMEGIVVLYGDNVDFAFGTSYPSYLEDLYQFHGDYPFAGPPPAEE